jgi:hypothetical protein
VSIETRTGAVSVNTYNVVSFVRSCGFVLISGVVFECHSVWWRRNHMHVWQRCIVVVTSNIGFYFFRCCSVAPHILSVVSFNSPEEGSMCPKRRVVLCVVTVEKVLLNIRVSV